MTTGYEGKGLLFADSFGTRPSLRPSIQYNMLKSILFAVVSALALGSTSAQPAQWANCGYLIRSDHHVMSDVCVAGRDSKKCQLVFWEPLFIGRRTGGCGGQLCRPTLETFAYHGRVGRPRWTSWTAAAKESKEPQVADSVLRPVPALSTATSRSRSARSPSSRSRLSPSCPAARSGSRLSAPPRR